MLESDVRASVDGAAKKTGGTIQQVMAEQSQSLNRFVQEARAGFDKDQLAAQEYSQSAQGQLQKVSSDVAGVGQLLNSNENAAMQKKQDLLQTMQNFLKQEAELKAKMDTATEQEKAHIEEEMKQLKLMNDQKIANIFAGEESELGELKKETGSYYEDERGRLQVAKGKVASDVGQHGNRVNNQLHRIDDATGKTHQYLQGFETQENAAESQYGKAVSDLGLDMQVSEDKVNEAVRDEDKGVAETMTGEIGNLENLMGDLGRVEKGANTKIGDMKSNFQDELTFFSNSGRHASQELEGRLAHVEDSAVDLVGEFQQDTASSQNELASTQTRLGKVVNSTMQQMEAFKQRLAEIRQSRETEAVAMHGDISAVKGEMTKTMGETVDVIEEMKGDTANAYKKMEAEQKVFDRMLVNASQLTSSHDGDEIQDMTSKMYELESNHSRLMSWQKQFKHYTSAWREEVKRKLGQLTGDIGSDEDQIAASRLHSELSMQEGMRGLQKSVEGEVVDAVSKESSAVGGLVNNIRNDMDQVFTESNHDEEAKTAEIMQTKSELNNAQAESNKEIGEISDAQTALQAKSNQFTNAVAAAQDEISGTLVLPQQSANQANQGYTKQMTDLQSRISGLESSFLQGHQRSYAVGAAGASDQDEAAALTSLNAQLRKENDALSHEDDALEARVGKITQTLKARGIAIP